MLSRLRLYAPETSPVVERVVSWPLDCVARVESKNATPIRNFDLRCREGAMAPPAARRCTRASRIRGAIRAARSRDRERPLAPRRGREQLRRSGERGERRRALRPVRTCGFPLPRQSRPLAAASGPRAGQLAPPAPGGGLTPLCPDGGRCARRARVDSGVADDTRQLDLAAPCVRGQPAPVACPDAWRTGSLHATRPRRISAELVPAGKPFPVTRLRHDGRERRRAIGIRPDSHVLRMAASGGPGGHDASYRSASADRAVSSFAR